MPSVTAKIFMLGIFFDSGINMALQDFRGKEEYIKHVNDSWVDFHWTFGLIISIVVFSVYSRWIKREIKENV